MHWCDGIGISFHTSTVRPRTKVGSSRSAARPGERHEDVHGVTSRVKCGKGWWYVGRTWLYYPEDTVHKEEERQSQTDVTLSR